METASNAVSIIWAVLFISATVISIFVALKLTKLENSIIQNINTSMEKSKKESKEEIKEEIGGLRREIQREMDLLRKEVDKLKYGGV